MATPTMTACIVALGARTAVGLRAPSSAAAVHAGITRIAEHPFMVDAAGDPFKVCMDTTLDAIDRRERMHALAASALAEVFEGLPPLPKQVVPIILGLPEPPYGLAPADVDRLCQRLAAPLVGRCQPQVTAIPEGNASAIVALERALDLVQRRTNELCIVGGVDSWIDADRLEELDAQARTLGVTHRWGFPPGEGAGMLAICSSGFARGSGLRPLAWIASVVTTQEPARMHTETVCTGEALGLGFKLASTRAGATITKQYCDMDGERYREHEFSFAILRAPAAAFADAVDYIAPASSWGSTGAATGALLATLPLLHHARGFSPGAWPMVWCGSESGRRGVVVLHLEG